jgi:hypothetical protein
MHQVAPVHAFQRKGSRVIARPQACVTDGHKHQEQRDNAHLLQPHWLPNGCLQQIAANGFSIPQDVIAILLQGFVRPFQS